MKTEKEILTSNALDEAINKRVVENYKERRDGLDVSDLKTFPELADVPYTTLYHRLYYLAAKDVIRLTRGRKKLTCFPVSQDKIADASDWERQDEAG